MFKETVEKYLKFYPADRDKLDRLLRQISQNEGLDERSNFEGHIAGDAIILSPDLKKVLFIHHLRSGRWQQPGGHLDKGETGPWLTAAREAYEETGVKLAKIVGPDKADDTVPLHIVTGPVTPSDAKKEPRHWHHDFRYGYIAQSARLGKIQDEGIGDAKWFDLQEALRMKDSGHEVRLSIDRLLKLLKA